MSYNSDGVLIADGSLDLTPGFLSGTSHGSWTRTGNRSYRSNGNGFQFDPQGKFNGMAVVKRAISLSHDGNSYDATGTYQFFQQGNVIFSTTLTLSATRILP